VRRSNHYGFWRCEEGFTLAEVIATIVIMGIVFAIASSTWFNVIEGRNVDSAANQLAADLRQAHSSAVNQLEPWVVTLTSGNSEYSIGQSDKPLEDREVRNFCDDGDGVCDINDPRVNIPPGGPAGSVVTITFKPDGSASVAPGGSTTFEVTVDGNPSSNVTLTLTTSRVDIV
jgi:prepilin-type N-terminal cleavage/methylation domain-containing protein